MSDLFKILIKDEWKKPSIMKWLEVGDNKTKLISPPPLVKINNYTWNEFINMNYPSPKNDESKLENCLTELEKNLNKYKKSFNLLEQL